MINYDLSFLVMGLMVFDFEGDGSVEVIYLDECFLWVYDGKIGVVWFVILIILFIVMEVLIVVDVDGDGKVEIVMVFNGVNFGSNGWGCDVVLWNEFDLDLV